MAAVSFVDKMTSQSSCDKMTSQSLCVYITHKHYGQVYCKRNMGVSRNFGLEFFSILSLDSCEVGNVKGKQSVRFQVKITTKQFFFFTTIPTAKLDQACFIRGGGGSQGGEKRRGKKPGKEWQEDVKIIKYYVGVWVGA